MMYSFEYDPGTGILRARLRGHWTLDVARRYSDELESRIIEARRNAGHLKLIVDASEHGTQMVEVVDYVVSRRSEFTRLPTDKVAVCATSQLTRNQTERYKKNSPTRVFATVAAARDWLLDRGESQSCAA